jgi:hypothetical protein
MNIDTEKKLITNEYDLEIYLYEYYLTIRAELEKTKAELAKGGNYGEAEGVKAKIDELKKRLTQSKRKELEDQHSSEQQNLDDNYRTEFDNINEKYNEKFMELDERLKKLEEDINEKHNREMEELFESLQTKLSNTFKHSKQYFELKKQEESLVRIQKYKT